MNYESTPCPSCNSPMAPVMYGYPTTDMIELAKQDMIALGGFLIGENAPSHYCYNCNEEARV